MNRFVTNLLLLSLLSVAGCATDSIGNNSNNLTSSVSQGPGQSAESNNRQQPTGVAAADAKPLTDGSTAALMYNLMVAEIAVKRELPKVAAAHYIVAVGQSHDPQIARRATKIALYSRNYELAERAARLWTELEPERVEPRQVLSAVYIQNGNRAAAREHLMALLELRNLNSSKQYLTLAQFFANKSDQEAVLIVLEEIADARPQDREAQYAAAAMSIRFANYPKALHYAKLTLSLDPGWAQGVLMHAQALALNQRPDEGVELLRTYTRAHPDEKQIHLALARMLLDANQPKEARTEFDRIRQVDPDNGEVLFALGLLNLQLGDLASAETHLLALEKQNFQENRVHFYLGRLAEKQNKPDQAIKWYSTISDKDYRVDATTRIAYLQAGKGDVDGALALLTATNTSRESHKIELAVAATDILIQAKRFEEAVNTATTALEDFHDDIDLLFSRSNAHEQAGNFTAMEADVEAILKIHPDNALALNALGYSLADRGVRLDEAHRLLTKALALEPKNPFILDSMGWAEYRLGNFEAALPLLRAALEIMPDGEVYAHLAELLIATGNAQQAKTLLQKGLAEAPDDIYILKVLNSLNALTESR
ncbi:MAG: tetratricopeptide repeat protein [Immundisolibacteraceae bacterium]|nr:tetratricopeptide repeat protein [Immundisolibacteraceae bacterium]